MVASAVLGAATGTGLALLVAMTLVVYRYYSARRFVYKDISQRFNTVMTEECNFVEFHEIRVMLRYGKDWGDVERFGTGNLNRQTSGTSCGGGSGKRRPGGPSPGITVSSQKVSPS